MQKQHIIFNDPIYGFIKIPTGPVFELIEHPYMQRLRRISQLGLSHLVYPGALHTRFHHALGAVHLMNQALETLDSKGHEITPAEEQGALIAILLHDIGHSPFSHTLEKSIVQGLHHESLSQFLIEKLNVEFNGQLDIALEIFKGTYPKTFLNQLVSSQLDVDRMDYLTRDSFFTGVYEGTIGYDRLIKMLEVHEGALAIEAKGIYSVENFIIARRLMYWQVYLHKTVLAAEQMLTRILERARELLQNETELFTTPALQFFLKNHVTTKEIRQNKNALEHFAQLDDFDILFCIKRWQSHNDFILSQLCQRLLQRRLLKVELQTEAIAPERFNKIQQQIIDYFNISKAESRYLVFTDSTTNSAYNPAAPEINILFKDGTVKDVARASDQLNISVLSKPVKKYYICYPKDIKGE